MKIQVPRLIAGLQPDAYLVGGCVRDLIQGRPPRDFDLAVSGDPRIFAEATATRLGGRVFVLGKDTFTVYCVATPKVQIDIMTCKGLTIKDDLLSRDFTINALACRLADGRIVDVAGGVDDLRRRLVRMVSPKAFRDDPARLVRVFRMAATLDFHIEAETIKAVRAQADLIKLTAAERIWVELRRILACPRSHQYLMMMYDSEVLQRILPEIVENHPPRPNASHGPDDIPQALEAVHSLEAILEHPGNFLPPSPARFVESLKEDSRVLLKVAMLLRNIGKPRYRVIDTAGRSRCCGHAARGAELSHGIGRRLRMSNRHREWIASLVRRHQRPLFLFRAAQGRQGPPPNTIGRFFRQCGRQAPHLLILAIAGNVGGHNSNVPNQPGMTEFLTEMLTHYVDKIQQRRGSPILDGRDLIRNFSLPPSPIIGTLLRRVDELYLAGTILDREQALQWVAKELKKHPPRGGRGCSKPSLQCP